MKTILLPTDFSSNANDAIDFAIRLYQDTDARFVLAHAYHVPQAGATMLISIDQTVRRQARAELEATRDRILTQFNLDTKRIDTVLEYGDVVWLVERCVREMKASNIVMGTTGAGNVVERMLGSSATAIIKKQLCPVLAIPKNTEFHPIQSIVLAADFTEGEHFHDLEELTEIANKFEAAVRIVHVETEDALIDARQAAAGLQLHHQLDAVPHTFHQTNGSNIASTIVNFVEEHPADLLVMLPNRYSWFEAIFHRSVTRQVAFETPIPLLVIPE